MNGTTAPLTATLTLPCAAEVANLGATTDNNKLEVRVASINRLGPLATDNFFKYISILRLMGYRPIAPTPKPLPAKPAKEVTPPKRTWKRWLKFWKI